MVRLKDDGTLGAKIIDLGLAKSLNEPGDQTAISTPGAFAGDTRVRQSGAIWWSPGRQPLGPVFAG
jgi:hypothetical protein